MARTETIPLSQRPLDKFLFIPFFLLNITVITYLIDIEQITTFPPVDGKDYPWWPPKRELEERREKGLCSILSVL